MSVPLDVGLRPACPHHQVQVQLVARRLETFRMQRADGPCLRRAVDEIVEAIDEPADAGVAAHQLIGSCGGMRCGHTEMYAAVRDATHASAGPYYMRQPSKFHCISDHANSSANTVAPLNRSRAPRVPARDRHWRAAT